jgi:uncharacterized protein (DUF1501 family)
MKPQLHTRRQFLRSSILGGALGWTIPAFLESTFFALQAAGGESGFAATGRDHPILVVVQLAGGNDGLNTLVPYAMDEYYRARPRLAIPADKTLKVNDEFGLHPSLEGLRQLYDGGHLGLIQGVGYPNPNRSHFRSTDIWQTASDASTISQRGWLGKYFDACCAGEDFAGGSAAGIAIGNQSPLAFVGDTPKSHTVAPTNQQGRGEAGSAMMENLPMDEAVEGASVDSLGGGQILNDPMAFLHRTALDARVNTEQVRSVTGRFSPSVGFPSTRLGRELEFVSQMIAGSLPARVFYVSQGGYDTHQNQNGAHDNLLGELDAALSAFMKEMAAQKNLDRVMVMTFSEFGRRVAENGSAGTDHGAAAPCLVLGGKVRPGLHGTFPGFSNLDRGDLVHTADFRSVYATILKDWLDAPPEKILGRPFPTLKFLQT